MTLDDLTKIYRDEIAKPEYPGWDEKHRAGIRAVVEALRDEIALPNDESPFGLDLLELEKLFNEILGDAGEKAAGGPTREDVENGAPRCSDTPEAVTPAADLSVGQRLVKAAKEASAIARGADASQVCEWVYDRPRSNQGGEAVTNLIECLEAAFKDHCDLEIYFSENERRKIARLVVAVTAEWLGRQEYLDGDGKGVAADAIMKQLKGG